MTKAQHYTPVTPVMDSRGRDSSGVFPNSHASRSVRSVVSDNELEVIKGDSKSDPFLQAYAHLCAHTHLPFHMFR